MTTRDQALAQAAETIEKQDEFIKRLSQQASPLATVAALAGARVVLAHGQALVEVNAPDFAVEVGDSVAVVQQSGQISCRGSVKLSGSTAIVDSLQSSTLITVSKSSEKSAALKSPSLILEEGDVVLLDVSGLVVLEKRESAASKYVRSGTGVTWDDIGGLEDVKAQMREIIELPLLHPDVFKRYGYNPPRGVLLAGPPGCGKTMIGKAAATAIAKAHGGRDGFIYVKGPEVLNKYVGESESRVRAIFDQARRHKRETGSPALVFIDEAEALLSARGGNRHLVGMESTIVPTFLAEMDGLEECAAVVVLATNRPEQLDAAIVRDGRVDRKIVVGRPDLQTIAQIAHIGFKRAPLMESAEDLAREVAREMISDERAVYAVKTSRGGVEKMKLIDLATGAMVANVVERSKGFALRRDLETGELTGVGRGDVQRAIDQLVAETKRIDHSEEIRDFCRKMDASPVEVERIAA